MSYRHFKRKNTFKLPRRVWAVLIGLILISVFGVLLTHHIYNHDLQAAGASEKTQVFSVKEGSSVKVISDDLQNDHLIRSAWAFQLYVHSKELSSKLQAGTYAFSQSEDIPKIATIMTKGRVSTELVTILPGQRIDQLKGDLINDGFAPNDVDNALTNLGQYSDLPVMTFKPATVNTLEGLLWPDSWYKDADTPASYIIRESLAEMGRQLTPDVQSAFAAEGLNVYQGLTLTSIVTQEVSKPADQAQAAQVFLSRLKSNSDLGSDAAARYGSIIAGKAPSVTYDSVYNTRLHPGLPPTPISTVSSNSLAATTHPASTNWLYFVSGDDGTTYFSNTLQDQQANTQKYCHKLCSDE